MSKGRRGESFKGQWHAACKERRRRNARDKIVFQTGQRQGIYTSQTSVIYKWPSEIIESKCKVNARAGAQSQEGEQVRGSGCQKKKRNLARKSEQ